MSGCVSDGVAAELWLGQSGNNEKGDATQLSVRGLAGNNFADGGRNLVAGVEYTRHSGLLYSDRFGGFKTTIRNPDNGSSTDGIPALQVIDDYRYAFFNEGGLPYFDSGAEALLGVDVPGVSLPGFGIAPNGNYIFDAQRSEEHTSELQSLMRISY